MQLGLVFGKILAAQGFWAIRSPHAKIASSAGCALQPRRCSWFFLLCQCFARNVLPGCGGQSGSPAASNGDLLRGCCDDPPNEINRCCDETDEALEWHRMLRRNQEPPHVGADASLSSSTDESLRWRSRGAGPGSKWAIGHWAGAFKRPLPDRSTHTAAVEDESATSSLVRTAAGWVS